ncbi:ABC transporter substrate-binding protein [Legionella maioricensis]|nr:ABC transporter substrate-binding protein [Legionella maioricensis]MCL9685951.1 ABC transporter substrate-binding protein [Legionella maioricensis]
MTQVLLKSAVAFCSFVLSLLLTGLYAAPGFNEVTEKSQVDVHIGIYAPFSSKHAFIGRNMLGAMEMARDQLKPSNVHYSFYTLDKLPEHRNPINTLQKFIKVHQIKVLLTEDSVNGASLAAFAKQNNIIHFSMASDPAIADGKNNFLVWSPAYEQASVLVKKLKQKKVNQLGIITTNHPSHEILTHTVVKQLQTDSSIKIATYEKYDTGTKDFSGLIDKIKGKNPDLYFIMASPEDIELIQSEMKTAHIDKPVTSIIQRVTPKVMQVFNGQWYVDTHEMKPEFVNQYQEANLNYPVTEAGYAFDVFHILNQSVIMAMKVRHDFTSQDLAEQIHNLAFGTGVMGPFNLDKNGVLYTQSEVKQVNQGKIQTA